MTPAQTIQFILTTAALFVPLIVAFLNYKDRRDDIYKTDRLSKRLDLLNKVEQTMKINSLDTIPNYQETIRHEIQSVLEFIRPSETFQTEKLKRFNQISKIRQIFLLFKPATSKIFVYQLAFYYFLVCIISLFYYMIFERKLLVTIFPVPIGLLVLGLILYMYLAYLVQNIVITNQIKKLSIS